MICVNKSIKQCLSIIVLFFIQAYGLDVDMRFSIGPAWHKFLSMQSFVVPIAPVPDITLPVLERIMCNYFLMPFAQYDIAIAKKYFLAQAFIGGGATARARGIIELPTAVIKKSLFIIDRNDTRVKPSILIADANIGFLYQTCFCNMRINPFLGYVFNDEKIKLETQTSLEYSLKNHWKGPYLGIAANTPLNECFSLNGFYKLVIARLTSHLLFYNPTTLTVPHSNQETAKTNAFGNIIGCELVYSPHCSYSVGTKITYMDYKIRNKATVCLAKPKNPRIISSFKALTTWQQIIWGFFFELLF